MALLAEWYWAWAISRHTDDHTHILNALKCGQDSRQGGRRDSDEEKCCGTSPTTAMPACEPLDTTSSWDSFRYWLSRQRAWGPHVSNGEELYRCVKCKVSFLDETPDHHIHACTDHHQVERCFRDRYRALQPPTTTAMGPVVPTYPPVYNPRSETLGELSEWPF